MATYIALVHQIAAGRCRVSFPHLPGCVAAGDSLHEAIAMWRWRTTSSICWRPANRCRFPVWSTRSIATVLVAAIEVPDDLTTELIDLAVPGPALGRFDLFAERRGMTRSAFLPEAANR
jgi:hypothetical protein